MADLEKEKKWAKKRVQEAVGDCYAEDLDMIWDREMMAEIDAATSVDEVDGIMDRLDMEMDEARRNARG